MSWSANLARLSTLCLALAIMVIFIGYASPYWITFSTGTAGTTGYIRLYRGLWQDCQDIDKNPTNCTSMARSDTPAWLKSCQVLGTLALIGSIVTILILLVWLCTFRLSTRLKVVSLVILIFTFIFATITVVIYWQEVMDQFEADDTRDPEFNWSFFLMFTGCILLALSIIFLIPVRPSHYGTRKHPDGYPFSFGIPIWLKNCGEYKGEGDWVKPYGSLGYGQDPPKGPYGMNPGLDRSLPGRPHPYGSSELHAPSGRFSDPGRDRFPYQGRDRPGFPEQGRERFPDQGKERSRYPDQYSDRFSNQGRDRFPDHSRDRYPDHSRDRYPDHSRDRYPDHSRDRYPDHSRDRYPDHSRDRYPDHSRDRYPDHGRDRYPDQGRGRY